MTQPLLQTPSSVADGRKIWLVAAFPSMTSTLWSLPSRLVIDDAYALWDHIRATIRDAATTSLDIAAAPVISPREIDYLFFFLAAGFFAAAFFAGFFALAFMVFVLPL